MNIASVAAESIDQRPTPPPDLRNPHPADFSCLPLPAPPHLNVKSSVSPPAKRSFSFCGPGQIFRSLTISFHPAPCVLCPVFCVLCSAPCTLKALGQVPCFQRIASQGAAWRASKGTLFPGRCRLKPSNESRNYHQTKYFVQKLTPEGAPPHPLNPCRPLYPATCNL